MNEIQWDKMWPAEFFWKEQRLLNRPITLYIDDGKQIYIYGYMTSLHSFDNFFHDIFEGHRLPLSRMRQGGSISKLQNKLQTESAEEFKLGIRDLCREYGLEAHIEKSNAGHIEMEGKGLGPIDVFAVDRKHKKFLLIEAKDVRPRISPKDVATERDQFLGTDDSDGYVQVLQRKSDWFRNHEQELKHEYRIVPIEDWTFEAIFVTSNPLMLHYLDKAPFPILWVDDFEDMLTGR